MVKAYNLPIDYVLYDMSYANMIMYGAVLPNYSDKKNKKKEKNQEIIKADNPTNNARVRKIIDGYE